MKFNISDVSTMAASEAYGNWRQFGSLAKLDFVIHGTPENQTAKIYANSRHMVEAIITVQILDSNDKKLNVNDDELKKELYFCHFETGENLGSPWTISDNPNDYLIEASNHSQESPDATTRYVYKYISCSKHEQSEITEKIAIGINVPGVGCFDTSRNGTSTKSKSGRVFKSPKSFEIQALRPIDYGLRQNVKIELGDFEQVSSNLKWISRLTTEGPLKEHDDGECKRRIAYIRPNKETTGQEKFKTHEIIYKPIENSDVSTGTIYWWWGTDQHEPCFSLIKNGYAKPCAVIGRGGDNFQVNLWYSRKNHVGIDGKFYVYGSSYYYQFNAKADQNHFGDDEHGAATLVLYKFQMTYDEWHYNWKNVINNVTVNVTDFYGNDGTLQLTFDDKDKFDGPGII